MPKSHRVNVRVTDEEFQILTVLATSQKITISECLRNCIDAAVERLDELDS